MYSDHQEVHLIPLCAVICQSVKSKWLRGLRIVIVDMDSWWKRWKIEVWSLCGVCMWPFRKWARCSTAVTNLPRAIIAFSDLAVAVNRQRPCVFLLGRFTVTIQLQVLGARCWQTCLWLAWLNSGTNLASQRAHDNEIVRFEDADGRCLLVCSPEHRAPSNQAVPDAASGRDAGHVSLLWSGGDCDCHGCGDATNMPQASFNRAQHVYVNRCSLHTEEVALGLSALQSVILTANLTQEM